jgi:hypothetical protein
MEATVSGITFVQQTTEAEQNVGNGYEKTEITGLQALRQSSLRRRLLPSNQLVLQKKFQDGGRECLIALS